MEIDLGAYFERIGYGARAEPTLETLSRLHALHVAAIPFENLSPFLGEAVRLDPASLQEKLVRGGRGGWCFEHNLLFAHVLRAIGFDLATLGARVRWNVAPGVATARSHMLLLVTIAGERFIADVGFGGLTLTAPLRLEPHVEQATYHELHRLVPAPGEAFVLEASLAGSWQPLYVFDLHEQQQADYEVSNWYLGNHPQSQFVTGLIAARAAPERRHALRNTRYTVHMSDGTSERRLIGSVADFRATLEREFKVPVPESALLDEKLRRLLEAAPPA